MTRASISDRASAILDELAAEPETGGLYMPECYADLARSHDHRGQYDEAIAAMERAIDHGWSGNPDGRSDIAEFHLRAGRADEAAAIWAELKLKDPANVWLYNAAGLSYSEVGEHELAIDWLGQGLALAMRTNDPHGIVAQLSAVRRRSLEALGRESDELEQHVARFLEQSRENERTRDRRLSLGNAFDRALPPEAAPPPDETRGATGIVIALSWFPAGEYEEAIKRWSSIAEDWADVPHDAYCHRLDGHIKWMRTNGVQVRAVAPIVIEDFVAWCEENDEDPDQARASYAAQRMADGNVIWWPPGRNQRCWCGSERKYKKCCGPASALPMHDREP